MVPVMKCLFGSHLYQLNTEHSDTDYKAIHIPKLEELVMNTYKKSIVSNTSKMHVKNKIEDIDSESYSLSYFVYDLAIKGQTTALDMLHATGDKIIDDSEIWQTLYLNRTKFYTKNMQSYIGYCRNQANKYGAKGSRMAAVEELLTKLKWLQDNCFRNMKVGEVLKYLPINEFCFIEEKEDARGICTFYNMCGKQYQSTLTLEHLGVQVQKYYDKYGDRSKEAKENNGIDWKAVSHAFRACYQVIDILDEGDFEYPLRQNPFLLQVKRGELNFKELDELLDSLITEIKEKCLISKLPEKADKEFWDKFLSDSYASTYNLKY